MDGDEGTEAAGVEEVEGAAVELDVFEVGQEAGADLGFDFGGSAGGEFAEVGDVEGGIVGFDFHVGRGGGLGVG